MGPGPSHSQILQWLHPPPHHPDSSISWANRVPAAVESSAIRRFLRANRLSSNFERSAGVRTAFVLFMRCNIPVRKKRACRPASFGRPVWLGADRPTAFRPLFYDLPDRTRGNIEFTGFRTPWIMWNVNPFAYAWYHSNGIGKPPKRPRADGEKKTKHKINT